jgi:LacI family transcriptional regulator
MVADSARPSITHAPTTDIAFLSDDSAVFSASERLAGFHEAIAAAGLPTQERWQITKRTRPEEWETLVTELLSAATRPTGLVTAQNFVTLGAVRALHRLNLQHQVALIGFDDIDFADIAEPGISVVPQQPLLLGRRAGEILFERLAGATYPPVREIVASDVIARGSGEIRPPAGEPA